MEFKLDQTDRVFRKHTEDRHSETDRRELLDAGVGRDQSISLFNNGMLPTLSDGDRRKA